jgi:hypothetical protein
VSSSSLIDKNGHKRTVYVRIDKQESKVKRKPGDSSTEKAKNLKISDFGTLDEVWEMAKMEREANTREEARSVLVGLINKPLKSKTGIAVTVSKNSIEKILSGKSTDKSYDAKAHFLAAANLEKLFSNTIEPFKFPFDPNKNNENYQEIKRLYAPMNFKGRIIPVKFTVTVMLNEKEGKRIYSLEAIDVDLNQK